MYKQQSLQPIIDFLEDGKIISPTDIAIYFNKSNVIIHKYLKQLLEDQIVVKIWKWTHAKYQLKNIQKNSQKKQIWNFLDKINYQNIEIIEKEFLKFDSDGRILEWIKWFIARCETRNLDIQEKSDNFVKIYKHIKSIQNDCSLLDVSQDFAKNIEHKSMDKLFYADQYKWMEFGRWKLAEMTFYAKQSQNIWLIKKSLDLIQNRLFCLISKTKPDAIAIAPHSIYRKNQLLKYLKYRLDELKIDFVWLEKYFPHKIPIPQKSLKTREQRIQNAKKTIIISNPKTASKYKRILLIDDFVGSGATLNETALKLKQNWSKEIIWFAFVWNINLSYEVINEI